MEFRRRRKRQAPGVIVVSLIDILLVLLIFLMVTSTFKQTPSLKIALPESTQAQKGAKESTMIVTINKESPFFFLDARPVTLESLQRELIEARQGNPDITLAIRPDKQAAVENFYKVIDAAKTANIQSINAFAEKPAAQQ